MPDGGRQISDVSEPKPPNDQSPFSRPEMEEIEKGLKPWGQKNSAGKR